MQYILGNIPPMFDLYLGKPIRLLIFYWRAPRVLTLIPNVSSVLIQLLWIWYKQCDQMEILFSNILPFAAVKICQMASKICQSMFNILPNTKWILKLADIFFYLIWQKWHNSAESVALDKSQPPCTLKWTKIANKNDRIFDTNYYLYNFLPIFIFFLLRKF